MNPIYTRTFDITDNMVDCYGRLKPSNLLFLSQDIAGQHCDLLGIDYETLTSKQMFWAITRSRVQISRLPMRGETLRVETWPMPTTRVAYPRSVVAYDEQGNECFRCISLWVLMDLTNRSMILPGRSGISVDGTLRGNELDSPSGLIPKEHAIHRSRTVCFTDLDRNGHMNNTRYLDWVYDLLPSDFHKNHNPLEFTVCYLSESREGQQLDMHWDFPEDGMLQVDAHRQNSGKADRVFSARILFD